MRVRVTSTSSDIGRRYAPLGNCPTYPAFNPWLVGNIQSFLYLNCPECSYRTKKKDSFQEHALQNHPLSCSFFEEDKFKIDPFENNDFIDDYASEQEVFKSDETLDDLCLFHCIIGDQYPNAK